MSMRLSAVELNACYRTTKAASPEMSTVLKGKRPCVLGPWFFVDLLTLEKVGQCLQVNV